MKIQSIKKWHVFLVWPALIACAIYLVSAFTHPLMAWTGPQAKVMFPPSLTLEGSKFKNIAPLLAANQIPDAKMVKLVPYKQDVLLQVTESKLTPRRYFSLDSGTELLQHDETQAVWLAEHYLKANHPVNNIELKTEFDTSYPAVNRLLPVYKINFDTEDNLSVYIHTETQALAGIENDWKRSLRFIFQTFHSFNWLDDYEPIRLLLISILVSALLAMSVTGLFFLIKLKRKKGILDIRRRWHRRLGWLVVVPLFMFSLSGVYHLWQSSLATPVSGMQLTQAIKLKDWPNSSSLSLPKNLKINQVSLVQITNDNNHTLKHLYRLSVSPIQTIEDQTKNVNTREKRFNGQKKEMSALYLDANTGEILGNLDKPLIQQQAKVVLGEVESTDLPMKLITHFGLGYDFRNKRLPVWRVEGTNGQQVFIDPITHILVDKNNTLSRLEGYSFSFLHKWNMLTPLTGRFNRDMLILTVLGLIFVLTGFGLALYLYKPTRHSSKPNQPHIEKQKQAA